MRSVSEHSIETVSGSRGLLQSVGLIFEEGDPARSGVDLPKPSAAKTRLGKLERKAPLELPGLTEPETLRHYVRLSQRNYAIDLGVFPLGSCTMKHNPRLNERMARLEGAPVRPSPSDPSVAERLSAADNAMRSLGIALAALGKRSDEIAARAEAAEKAVAELRDTVQGLARNAARLNAGDVDALQKRIASLEQAVKGSGGDKAARLALTAVALRDAVMRGAPFTAELEEARALGAEERSLAPLVPFAAKGVPAPATLAQDLRAVMPAMVKESGAPAPAGNFLERLQANAAKLVRIRPVDAPVGDDPSTVLARIEVEAARADIDAVLIDLAKLDTATRAPAREWIGRARARQAAIAAARQLTVDTMRVLGNR